MTIDTDLESSRLAEQLGVTDVRWDHSPLLVTPSASGSDALLADARVRAERFERHRGTIANLSAAELADVMQELADVVELIERTGASAYLNYSADFTNAAFGATLAATTEQSAIIGNHLVFFDLEWAALDDAQVETLLADPALEFCRHSLRVRRLGRPHLLSEGEEKVMAEKSVTGAAAWVRLFDDQLSATSFDLDDERKAVPFEVAGAELMHHDVDRRRRAASALTEGLKPGLATRAYIYNVIIADKAIDDRFRSYATWASSRNLGNQTSDESVQALVDAVVSRYDIVQRWYRLKARLLNMDKLHFSDRNATLSIGASESHTPWSEARQIVLSAFESFSPRIAKEARRFFDEHRVDAPATSVKRSGAFCMPTVPGEKPYVFVNYTGTRSDVLTLAHELGHGVHFALSQQKRSIFEVSVPLTVAETASVFGETVTFTRMLDAEQNPAARLNLLAYSIDSAIATVFRQVSMFRFEELCHNGRRASGELSVSELSDNWITSQRELFGDTVVTDGYETWWSYVSHFFHVPGYVYAYAFGQLLALSVFQRFLDVGPSFVPKYEAMLEAGGSRSPEELAAMVDCNLRDPQFWVNGLGLIERTLRSAEEAAATLGYS